MARFILDPNNPPTLSEESRRRLDAMTPEEIEQNALSDPDNPPMTDEELAAVRVVGLLRKIRAQQGLTQQAFADRYRIPIGTMRDWEQGRSLPDSTARAYLDVIANAPRAVEKALSETLSFSGRP